MSKKIKEQEYEDDIEDELDEDELEDSESSEEEEKEGDSKKEPSEEGSSEEDSEEDGEKSSEDKDREAIRERRRREKKMKKERDRREKQFLMSKLEKLEKELAETKTFQSKVSKNFEVIGDTTLNNEIKEVESVYNQSLRVMEKAISDGDGKRFAEAKAINDKALVRHNQLSAMKSSPREQADERNAPEAEQAQEGVVLGQRGKHFGINWIKKNSSWYDPQGNDLDSTIVRAIDVDLYNQGYDPETKEYWDELSDRVAEKLPHRARAIAPKKTPPQRVGSSGADNTRTSSADTTLPKDFVQTLKAAGYWDDPEKKKAAIKNYYANRTTKKGA